MLILDQYRNPGSLFIKMSYEKVDSQTAWTSESLKRSVTWQAETQDTAQLRDIILNELEHGAGVFLIRGLPIEHLSPAEAKAYCLRLGKELGTPVFQDPQGTLVVDIRSTDENGQEALHYALKTDGKNKRPYETNFAFSFHTDPCDVAGLLCIHPALQGGESRIASAVAIHAAIAEKNPDLLKALYETYHYAKPPRSNHPFGFHQIPIFSEFEGHFKSHVVPELIYAAQKYPEVPRLSSLQIKALEYLERLAHDPYFYCEVSLTPGDLLWVNNHIVYHARTSYDDGPSKRHLLRLWLAVANSRPLHPIHQTWFGDTRPGSVRGGYHLVSGNEV